MRVLVTGGCGKAGAWVARELARPTGPGAEAHEVTVYDRADPPPDHPVRHVKGDVLDRERLAAACAGQDAVVHLAAVPRPGLVSDHETFETNVMGTYHVHELAQAQGVRRVVTMSSAAVLGWTYRQRDFSFDYLPVDEAHPLRAHDAYSLSKVIAERIVESYAERGALETVVLRPNWVADPAELAEVRASGGRPVTDRQTFSYVDVRDLAVACRLAVDRPVAGHTVAFVVADDTVIGEPLARALPRVAPWMADMAAGLDGTRPLIANVRAKELLGWAPRFSWRDL